MRTHLIWICCAALACGDDDAEQPTPEAETTEAPETETAEPEAEVAEPETPATPATPEVDLLGAVGTELAVSSAYRDRSAEVPRLFDGDLETAWNSASGELTDSWIEVRIPEGAEVTGIEMTAGYTRVARNDLFTSNHRITKVRVTKDGEELVVHELDRESRELQRIGASGGAGVYRIEVVEVLPGEREDWTETCVSELRVLGRATNATEGKRFPVYGIGTLPERAPVPERGDGWGEQHRQLSHRIVNHVREMETEGVEFDDELAGDMPVTAEDTQQLRHHRNAAIELVGQLVAHDPVASDQVRRVESLARDDFYDLWMQWKGEALPTLAEAMDHVAEQAGDREARCRWAKGYILILVNRMFERLDTEGMSGDSQYWTLGDIRDEYSRNTDRHLRSLRAMDLEASFERPIGDEWRAMDEQLELAEEVCASE